MNTLAQHDLRAAYEFASSFRKACESGAMPASVEHSMLGSAIDALEKLCHVCQALSEEQDSKPNPEDRLAELQLRIYKLEKALKCHTDTQDAHNF